MPFLLPSAPPPTRALGCSKQQPIPDESSFTTGPILSCLRKATLLCERRLAVRNCQLLKFQPLFELWLQEGLTATPNSALPRRVHHRKRWEAFGGVSSNPKAELAFGGSSREHSRHCNKRGKELDFSLASAFPKRPS